MSVNLSISFEMLLDLIEQLPENQRQALIQRLNAHSESRTTSAVDRIKWLKSAQVAAVVNQEPSIHRQDWYDDAR